MSLDHLRARDQRYRIYLALWDPWQVAQSTPLLADAGTSPPTLVSLGTKDEGDVPTVVNIGPNRLAFAGEAIAFDAARSFRVHDLAIAGTPSWTFAGATPSSASGFGPHPVTWATPGLYDVTCALDGRVARRQVRVLADRTDLPHDVVAVAPVAGSVQGGWKTQLTIAPRGSDEVAIADYQAVGLFVEEEWFVDGVWERVPVSGYDPDPRLLIAGYVEQGSLVRDANTHRVTFALASVADQMNLGFVHATQSWSKAYVDADQALPVPSLPSPLQGVVFDLPDGLFMPDVLVWWLATYTNVLDYHDLTTWYDDTMQELDTVTTGETSLWNAFGSLAENEFAWWFADQGSGLHFEPNPSIRSAAWWQAAYPIRLGLTEADLLTVAPSEDKMRNVIWVQLIGTRVRDGRQWTVRYPDETPPSGAGSWYQKKDLVVSRFAFLAGVVERVYLDANRKFSAQLSLPLNRALRVPDRIELTVELPDRGISWVAKRFIVTGVSHQIDPGQGTWLTTITVDEEV